MKSVKSCPLSYCYDLFVSLYLHDISTLRKKVSYTVSNEEFTLKNRSADICLYYFMFANHILPPVLFSRQSLDGGKLLPTFVNKAEAL